MSDAGYTEGVRSIETALSLLDAIVGDRRASSPGTSDTADLLHRCLLQLDDDAKLLSRPIRSIHHLSCTGGTLIAKCIAAMPNILLLNEVDPLSTLLVQKGKPAFTPTDMVSLLRQGDPNLSTDALVRMFVRDIEYLASEQARVGRDVVLRDHSHSHFLTGDGIGERPTLREILREAFDLRSVVTVRVRFENHG